MKLYMMALMFGLFTIPQNAHAWNPITDIRDNVVWTFGKTAEVGEAVKLGGAGTIKNGETTTSMMAGIADYRFLTFSYGGTIVNREDSNFTDSAKIGFKVISFLGWFKNAPTDEMSLLKNVNIGPAFSMPLFRSPHAGTIFLDVNYTFGASK
jgi:hypothetical protein